MAKKREMNLVMQWTYEGLHVQKLKIPAATQSKNPGSSVGITSKNKHGVIRSIKQGLPFSAFEKLQKEMGISAKKLAQVLYIADRTLTRRKNEGRFQPGESERLVRLGSLFDRAVDVLGNREDAQHWFQTPKKTLGGQSPLEYADTELGAREVEDLLGRIEHGVFS